MLITNGKILICQDNNKEVLGRAADKIEKYLLEEKAIKIEMKESEDHCGFALIVPEEVTWQTMSFLLSATPGIQFKGINDKEIILPSFDKINVQYRFKTEEKEAIATENMEKQEELERLEAKRKQVMDEYKAKIQAIEERIIETRQAHTQGYEYRDYDCIVKLDLEERKRYYIDKYDGTTIRKVEDFGKRDYQSFINHKFEGTLSIGFGKPADGGDEKKEPSDEAAAEETDKEKTFVQQLIGENANDGAEEDEDDEDEDPEEDEEEETEESDSII